MSNSVDQKKNTVNNGDLVGGDKYVTNNYKAPTKLSSLFDRLQKDFNDGKSSDITSDNLKIFSEPRDVIGLEQKLTYASKTHLIEDAKWLKELYFKKLTKYQFFEPAQEIHALLLGLVLEKFRNLVYPKLRAGVSEEEIHKTISESIVDPIIRVVQEEGCNDIMGLGATDISGMVFFLTGQCHIKWQQDDSISPSV